MAQGGNGGFLNKFTEAIKKKFLAQSLDSQLISGLTAVDMPEIPLAHLQEPVLACNTGPGAGLTDLSLTPEDLSGDVINRASVVAGVLDWSRPHPQADGMSISLYEKQINSSHHHGDPIADSFAITARPNSCLMSLADGINWGHKPRLAARAAILGVMNHMYSKLFESSSERPKTTRDIFHHILLSFDEAQKEILAHKGTTTTLTVAMVCELLPNPQVNSRWGLCVVSVGDSPCFIYSSQYSTIHEVTAAAHMGKDRDPRDTGGCLGANLGDDPDLSNLICCFLPVSENDVVFLTSDGISDNFDPIILKEGRANSPISASPPPSFPPPTNSSLASMTSTSSAHPPPPSVVYTPKGRQDYSNTKMASILKNKQSQIEHLIHAQDVIDVLIAYTINITDSKRKFLEKVWEDTSDPSLSPATRRNMERRLSQQSKALPGKLDHTSIVAYKIGDFPISQNTPEGLRPTSQRSLNMGVPEQGGSRDVRSRRGTGAAHPGQFRRLFSADTFRV